MLKKLLPVLFLLLCATPCLAEPEAEIRCASGQEMLSAVGKCADADMRNFRLVLSENLAEKLFADGRLELDRLLSQTRLKKPSDYSYSEKRGTLYFSDAVFYPDSGASAGSAETLPDFLALFSAHTDSLETEFEIMVPEVLRAELLGQSTVAAGSSRLLTQIYSNCGIFSLSSYTSGHFFGFRKVEYYPGKSILYAYRNSLTGRLSAKENQTLEAALGIVSRVSGTDLEKEKQIHDLLCSRIEYYTDDIPHNENDCAVGALLNGRADCDGYSDAFYLCANLAGLQARHQHGASADSGLTGENAGQTDKDGTHMWNLVCVGGRWVMLDVTWDDKKEDIVYVYYNIGTDRASLSHVWDPRAVTEPVLSVSDNSLRNPELAQTRISTWEELYALMRKSSASRAARVCFTFDPSLKVPEDPELFRRMVFSSGIEGYKWTFSPFAAEIYQIRYCGEFTFCDTDAEIAAAVGRYAAAGTKSFTLYFHPSISGHLFADGMKALKTELVKTRLRDPFKFSYSADSRKVTFQEAAYFSSDRGLAYASVRTMDEVYVQARQFAADRKERIIFISSGSFDLNRHEEELGSVLHSVGISHYSWRAPEGFTEILDIVYRDNCTICDSEAEILSAVEFYAARRAPEFSLCFHPSVSDRLFADGMRSLKMTLAKTRIRHPLKFSYDTSSRRISFSEASYYSSDRNLAAAAVYSMNDVYRKVCQFAEERKERIIFSYADPVDLHRDHQELSVRLYGAGIQDFSWAFWDGFIEISDIVYYEHYRICSSESEVVSYLKECRKARLSEIRIYCSSESLYASLHSGQSKRFFELLSNAGCKAKSISYNDSTRLLLVENPVW